MLLVELAMANIITQLTEPVKHISLEIEIHFVLLILLTNHVYTQAMSSTNSPRNTVRFGGSHASQNLWWPLSNKMSRAQSDSFVLAPPPSPPAISPGRTPRSETSCVENVCKSSRNRMLKLVCTLIGGTRNAKYTEYLASVMAIFLHKYGSKTFSLRGG